MIPGRRIAILQAITAIGAVVALVISVTSITTRIDAIQTSRARAAYDSCNLFRAVVLIASVRNHRLAAGEVFLQAAGLGNCDNYARRVISVPHAH